MPDGDDEQLISIPPQGQDDRPIAWRGVNLLADPRRIGDDELVLSQNVAPVRLGILAHRPAVGFLFASDQVDDRLGVSVPINAAIVPFASDISFIVAHRGVNGNPQQATSLRSYRGTGVGLARFLTQVVTARKPSYAFFQNAAICCFGPPYSAHGGAVSTVAVPGFTTFDFLDCNGVGAGDAGPYKPNSLSPGNAGATSPQVCATYGDRMVYGNWGPGLEGLLVFSDSITPGRSAVAGKGNQANIPFTVASSGGGLLSRAIQVGGARDGDRIVAMTEIMMTAVGGVPQRALLVLKEYSAYLYTGEPNQTTDNQASVPFLGTLNQLRAAVNCGCASPETVAYTPYGVFWVGPDDVWFFAWGQTPVRVGSKIRPAILRTPAPFRYRWHAAYFNGFYRIAIDSDGQGVDHDAPCGEQWWLDLRDGPPQGSEEESEHQFAKWWGPQQFQMVSQSLGGPTLTQGTRCMVAEARSNQPPALYGVEVGTAAAAANPCFLQYDTPSNRDVSYDGSLTPATVPTGTEIIADVRTKEYDLGDSRKQKMILTGEANVWVDSDCILNMDFNVDGGGIVDKLLRGVAQLGFQADVDPLDSSFVTRQTQGIAWNPSPTQRDIGFTFQLRLYDIAGYFVVKGVNDQLVFAWTETPAQGSNNWFSIATITPGYYANITALINAIATAMAAASDEPFSSLGPDGTGHQRLSSTVVGSTWHPAYAVGDISAPYGNWNSSPRGAIASANVFTAAQYRSTKKLMALLGIDTGVTGLSLDTRTITALAIAFQVTVPIWELGDLAMSVVKFPRRPLSS